MTTEALDVEFDEDAEWDKLDAEDRDEPEQSLAETLTTDAPEQAAADQAASEADFEDEPAVENPADEPAAPVEAAKPDPIAELNKAIAGLSQTLQSELRAVNGRVGGLQDTVKQMRTVQAEAAAAKAAASPNGPSAQEIKDAEKSPAEWEALKNDFPDWASGVEKYVASKVQAAKPAAAPVVDIEALIAERINPLVEQRVAAVLDQRREAEKAQEAVNRTLDEAYPGWVQTINSPEFIAWQNSQPRGIQALAQSDDVQDAIAMLNLFKPPVAEPVVSGKTQAQVAAERKQRLAQSAVPTKAITNGPRSAIAFDDMTEDQQWAYLDRLDRQKEARR